MNDHHSFQKFAAITAIVSFPLALASIVLSGMITNFSPDVATNPVLMLAVGTSGATLVRWGMILDMFGNYLPILPIALFVQYWLRAKSPTWYIVFGGVWNMLGELLAGLWFIGIGSLLWNERRILGSVGMIAGVSALLDSLGNILSVESLALVGLSIYIILGPIWLLWFGIDLLRRPVQIQNM